MGDMPTQLLAGLSPSEAAAARAWWDGLTSLERSDLAALFAPLNQAPGDPKIIGGRFIASDEAAGWAEWRAACFEDLVNLPDLAFYEPPTYRTFYIG